MLTTAPTMKGNWNGAVAALAAAALTATAAQAADTNAMRNSRIDLAGFPIVFYSPETSLGLGGGLVATFRRDPTDESRRPDSLSLYALYTFESQFTIFVAPEVYADSENWKLRTGLGYSKFPADFYGIGNHTLEDDEESYTTETVVLKPGILRRVVSHLRAGVAAEWKDTDVTEMEPGGLLAQSDLVGLNGGALVGVGPAIEWDTRDSLFSPSRGSRIQINGIGYREELGSDFEYEAWGIDARHYRPVGPAHVLGFQIEARGTSGEVPFTEYPGLDLRGIINTRFRDRVVTMVQAEYRFPIRKRFTGVLFAGAGEVAPDLGDWRLDELKFAGGAGLRFMLNRREKINLRFDLGIGEDDVYPYVRMLETF